MAYLTACYGVITDGEFTLHHVDYDPTAWLDALNRITPLEQFVGFREWFRQQQLTGFGIGVVAPWTDFAARGYR